LYVPRNMKKKYHQAFGTDSAKKNLTMLSLYDNIVMGNKAVMKLVLRIKEVAKESGITLSSVARKLGIHRSNMSAIASGSRGVSLKTLKRIGRILDCSIDELIEPEKRAPVFKNKKSKSVLDRIEKANYDGIDKSWVDRLMFAQRTHYGAIGKGSRR